MLADEEYKLLLELARGLLRHFPRSETLAVDKGAGGVDGLEAVLSFKGDVFDGDKVDLQRIQFLGQKIREQGLVRLHLDV